MTGTMHRPTSCDNMNHRRANSPVAHCPECGGVVNRAIPAQHCSDEKHAVSRRQRSVFCVDCGTQLVVRRI